MKASFHMKWSSNPIKIHVVIITKALFILYLQQLKDLSPEKFSDHLNKDKHTALATTMDNAGTLMRQIESKEDVITCLNRTAYYFIVHINADAFDQ